MQSLRQHKQIKARLSRWADGQPITTRSESESSQPVEAVIPSATSWDDFDNDLNPKNWPLYKKLGATLMVTSISVAVQYASSVDSAVAEQIQADFGVSTVTESLATGLFLVGFGIGAPVAGPMSEIAGRNPVYIISLAVFMLFTVGAALAPNIGAQLAFRFLAGMFGSSPLVCAGGTMFDLWTPSEQIYVFPMYAAISFTGLPLGPVIGGVIAESKLVGWRWVEYSTLILSGSVLLLVLLLQPETSGPALLQWKAKLLARHHKAKREDNTLPDDNGVALARVTTRALGRKIGGAFYRSIRLSLFEPIILMFSLYLSVLYIVIFTFLPGYTNIYTDTYGFGPTKRGLTFLGLVVGFLLALALVIPIGAYSRKLIKRNGELHPEARLFYAMCGAPAVPVSLLWMGWTARPSISPWSPLAASALLGFGVLCVFISTYQYIIHVYKQDAAIGLVFVTLTRYLVAGGMIVVGVPMYGNLGVAWTLTILGILGGLLVPIPFCLFWFGSTIRGWSKLSNMNGSR